jgi:hypothetical protein
MACTLLGPEGPGRRSSDRRDDLRTRFTFGRVSNGFEYRPSFENYTVDASILERDLRVPIYKMIK